MVLIAIKQQLIYSVRINKLSRRGGHPRLPIDADRRLNHNKGNNNNNNNKIYKIYLITIIFKILQ
jgi:hypothetical protein